MRADTLRTYKTVHTWTGIVAGLALFIAFYAGALTMFKAPIARWVAPPLASTPAGAARADALVARTLAARPDAQPDFTLHLGDGGQQPHRVTWQKRGDPAPVSAALAADGALQIGTPRDGGLAGFIDVVHRTAGLPVGLEWGAGILGVVSALYALAIVSGVIVLWPTLVKDFFALRVGPNLKRMWLDAHNVIGIVSLPFHLIMALSAVVFGLHDLVYDAQKVAVYGEARFEAMWNGSGPFAGVRPDATPAPALPLQALVARVEAQVPGFAPHTLRFRGAGTAGGVVWITGAQPCCMPRSAEGSLVLVSAVDGRLLYTEYLAGHQSGWMATVSAFFSLHFGNYGGAPVRWAYFFLGLAGAFLFYSGNLLWIESRRKAQRAADTPVTQRRATAFMAAATVGVCLGCICGLSLTLVAGKWLHGHVADLAAWHRWVYYAVFLGSVGWAFARGAARASVHLLWLAALAAWAIPLTSGIGWLLPATGWWAHGQAGPLGVDIVAALGGLGFAAMARATARRVGQGAVDSVWSARGVSAGPEGERTA